MRIGILLPDILTTHAYGDGKIFAPLPLAVDLVNGLKEKGHTVLFYTSSDVKTTGESISGNEQLTDTNLVYERAKNLDEDARKFRTSEVVRSDFENDLTMKAYLDARDGKIDIIHSFINFTAHYFDKVTGFPTIYTLHDPLPQTEHTIEYERLTLFKEQNYVSISMSQRKSIVRLNFVANIYHGIDLEKYPLIENTSDDLVFIGRILPDKGVDIAIQAALSTQKKLAIASSDNYKESDYFKETIEPYQKEGKIAIFGFFPTDAQKAAFLGNGKAFLFPLQWEEPFGLVMIEAMATGTPVIAFARGSVPEIVIDGETGFLVNPSDDDIRGDFIIKKTGIEGMKEAVERLYALSLEDYTKMRQLSRKRVEEHFTAERMVDNYEALYISIINPK
ncbi:MAG: glycosyltransferase [Candidatus Levybacteria bacterium]|nr:glycosyltransferase [Candidatus Levybacteria bacterium]